MAGAVSAKIIYQGDKTRIHTFAADQNVGDIVALADRCGITTGANVDISAEAQGQVLIEGIFQVTKEAHATDRAWVDGEALYWDPTSSEVSDLPVLGSWFVGFASGAAASTATTGNVSLAPFSAEVGRVVTANAAAATTLVKADVTSGNLVLLVPNTTTVTVTVPALSACPAACDIHSQKTDATAAAITYAGNAADDSGTLIGTVGTHDAADDRIHLKRLGDAFAVISTTIA